MLKILTKKQRDRLYQEGWSAGLNAGFKAGKQAGLAEAHKKGCVLNIDRELKEIIEKEEF